MNIPNAVIEYLEDAPQEVRSQFYTMENRVNQLEHAHTLLLETIEAFDKQNVRRLRAFEIEGSIGAYSIPSNSDAAIKLVQYILLLIHENKRLTELIDKATTPTYLLAGELDALVRHAAREMLTQAIGAHVTLYRTDTPEGCRYSAKIAGEVSINVAQREYINIKPPELGEFDAQIVDLLVRHLTNSLLC